MYDELIRQFRDKAERHKIEGKVGLARDYTHAADAIEELSKQLKKREDTSWAEWDVTCDPEYQGMSGACQGFEEETDDP